jgi:S1-C subfamily serine protease
VTVRLLLRIGALAALLLLALPLASEGCGTLLDEQTYKPIPIQSGAEGRIVASTVDVRASRREGDLLITSLGTGVVVREDGLIVTADHVLTDEDGQSRGEIEVIVADGRSADGVLVARVPARDLAFVRVDLAGLRPATLWPDLERVAVGDRVLAVGAPHNFERFVVRGRILGVTGDGTVRVEGRDLGPLIQSSARIRRGFSGGPLADARGRLIGINVGSTEPGEDGRRTAVAVPAQAVADALAAL